MKGKIKRVTYNEIEQVAEFHLEDGNIKTINMSSKEWNDLLKGDFEKNINDFLNE